MNERTQEKVVALDDFKKLDETLINDAKKITGHVSPQLHAKLMAQVTSAKSEDIAMPAKTGWFNKQIFALAASVAIVALAIQYLPTTPKANHVVDTPHLVIAPKVKSDELTVEYQAILADISKIKTAVVTL